MNFKHNNFKVLTFCIFVLIFVFLGLIPAKAQIIPQFVYSWKSESYVPQWYEGKALPTKGSFIDIGFELLEGNYFVNLSQVKARWYVNDKLIKNEKDGLGIKSLKFNISDYPGNLTEVKISLPDYRGGLTKIIYIPIKNPEIVIPVKNAERSISVGDNYFQAIPFFFNAQNISDFSFEWSANNLKEENNYDAQNILKLSINSEIPDNFLVNISAVAKNLLNELESASKNFQIRVVK